MEHAANFSIKSWAEDDRPREKLRIKGRTHLSDAELIAILIGSGNKSETAVDLSKRILKSVNNNLNELGRVSVNDLRKFNGVGEAKAISIVAALEIGRRRKQEVPLRKIKIKSSKDAFEVLFPILSDIPHEEFWILLLNRNNTLINKYNISRGGISGTVVDNRMIFNKALEHLASGIILCHNHPSGNLLPSKSDIKLTKKIKEAAKYLDIMLLDHIIVAEDSYYSFADAGLI